MGEEILNDIPNQALEALEAGAIGEPKNEQVDVHEEGVTFGGLLSFAGTCTINLVLPFVNGLMLGFGELLAHEIAWRNNLFDKRKNKGYRIYPERRKLTEASADQRSNGKFL